MKSTFGRFPDRSAKEDETKNRVRVVRTADFMPPHNASEFLIISRLQARKVRDLTQEVQGLRMKCLSESGASGLSHKVQGSADGMNLEFNLWSPKSVGIHSNVFMRKPCRRCGLSQGTVRMTPAMAAGVADTHWTVADLVDMIEA